MNQNSFTARHLARASQRRAHLEQLEDQITELAAHISAATYRLLELIREYDLSEGWSGPGLNSCAHWLNWKCGISLGTAREKVRVAHALSELPRIGALIQNSLEATMQDQLRGLENVPAGTFFHCAPRWPGSNYGRPIAINGRSGH